MRIEAADRASTTAATSACWRERPLTGNFRGDLDRLELAGCVSSLDQFERRVTTHSRDTLLRIPGVGTVTEFDDLSDNAAARRTLEELIAKIPQSEAAQKARARLGIR